MKYIELFERFSTGEIDDSESLFFFSDLSTNPELRAEFKSFMALSKSLKIASSSYSPSLESKSRIFEKAGFSIPIAADIQNTETKSLNRKNLHSMSKGFVLGSILPAIIFLVFMNYRLSNNIDSEAFDKHQIPVTSLNTECKQLTKSYSNTTEKKRNNKLIKSQNYYNNRKVDDKDIAIQSGIIVNDNNRNNNKTILKLTNSSATRNIIKYNKNKNGENEILSFNINKNTLSELGFVLELRNSFAWNSIDNSVSPNKLNPLNNLNATLFYELSENVKLGVELKQETFLTQYTGLEANGAKYRYLQQPNFTTFSMATRFTPFIFNTFKPFTQIGFGFNRGGYTVKPEIGLEYKLAENIVLVGTFEYTHFWFFHGSNWFNTKKIGVSYGLSYKF